MISNGSLDPHRQFRLLFKAMSDGVALHRIIFNDENVPINYIITDVNPAYERILGFYKENVVGKSADIVYGTKEPPYFDVFAETAITGISREFETFFPLLQKHFLISVMSFLPGTFAAVFHDITPSKKIEKDLEDRISSLTQPIGDTTNVRFEDLFSVAEIQSIQDAFSDATGVASIITDIDGQPITLPSNFCRLCNEIIRKTEKGRANCYYSDSVLGQLHTGGPRMQPCLSGGLWDAGTSITVGDRQIANWLIGQVLDEAQSEKVMLDYAITIGANPDDFRAALSEVKRMPIEQFQKITEALYIIARQLSKLALQNVQQARNITAQHKAEETITKQVAELEGKNAELERFTYTVSHDLKSPLITIKGFLAMLVSDARSGNFERLQQDINRIANAADKMESLLEDLLELSRIGRIIHPPSLISMSKVITDVLELLSGSLESKNIVVTVQENLPDIFVDVARIREAVQNLFENAVKYMGDQPAPEISVSFQKSSGTIDGARDEYRFFIRDNGIGIEPKYHSRIFGLFDKLNPASPGTGIGLALVKRIIELHGGFVSVESQGDGFGSTFIFSIPIHSE